MVARKRIKGVRLRKRKVVPTTNFVQRQVTTIPPRMRLALDKAALEYRNMLLNPCDGPLVHGLYASGGQGITIRAETSFNVNTTAGSTAGYVHYSPGAFGTGTTYGCTFTGESSGGVTAAAAPQGYVPGLSFLGTNASSVRPLAACMQIMYAGTEANRGGIVYLGNTSNALILPGTLVVPDTVITALSHCERMPTDSLEVIWKPGTNDGDFVDTGAQASGEGKSSITFAWTGVPAATPIRVRIVTIWEFKVSRVMGLIDDNSTVSNSDNTLNDVMKSLQDSGAVWVRRVGRDVARNIVDSALGSVQAVAYGHTRTIARRILG